MTKRSKLIGLMGVLLLVATSCASGFGGPPAAADAANPWQIIQELRPEHSFAVAGFSGETVGITGGAFGHVYYSADGGQSWAPGEAPSGCRFGLDMLDETTAWSSGRHGVWLTTDGGQSWQEIYDLDNERTVAFVSFLDLQTGWVGSSNQLWATSDGGQTWAELTLPAVNGHVIAIALRTAADGYLLDESGTIYVTADGGESWTSLSLALDDEIVASPITPTAVMRFFDESHGVVILSLRESPESLTALRTSDGGQSWTQESIPVRPGTMHLTHDGTLLTVVVGLAGDLYLVRY